MLELYLGSGVLGVRGNELVISEIYKKYCVFQSSMGDIAMPPIYFLKEKNR